MKHTPGPWVVKTHQRASLAEASIEIQSTSGRTICDMGDDPNNEDKANARLITAAPDAVRLAQAVADHFEDTHAPLGQLARDWLAKATE